MLSRRPSGTDPSTHPSTDEIAEDVRVVAAAQDPHEFDFGTDMMAWTLAMGHSMVRAGLAIKGRRNQPWRPDVVHAHDWLVAHAAIALADRGIVFQGLREEVDGLFELVAIEMIDAGFHMVVAHEVPDFL